MNKIKKLALKVLDFCSLISHDKKLSITNIAVIVLITKMALAPSIDWPTTAALMLSLLNYSHKRVNVTKDLSLNKTLIEDVKTEMGKLIK